MELKTENFLDLEHTIAKDLFIEYEYPWEVFPFLNEFILGKITELNNEEYNHVGNNIWVHNTSYVAPTAVIEGPCIVGEHSEIRNCAYIRGNVIIGDRVIVGHACEIKNSVLFDDAKIPHLNFLGDSVVGYNAALGAGAVLSNTKGNKYKIRIRNDDEIIETNMTKLGAIIGDNCMIGSNCVCNPGTIIGRDSQTYPCVSVRGVIPEDTIVKSD